MGVGSHGIRKPWDFVFRGELEFGIVSCEDIKTEENCIVFVGSELWIGNSEITSSTRRFVNLQLFGSGSGFGYYGPKTQNFHQRLGPIRVFFFFLGLTNVKSKSLLIWDGYNFFFFFFFFDRRWIQLNSHIAYFSFSFFIIFLSYRINTLPTWCLKGST